MTSYKGYGARPELIPLRDGVLDFSLMNPERGEHMGALLRGYGPPPIADAAQQAFVGITADGQPIPGLFALEDTGLDSKPIVAAAQDLLSALDLDERTAVSQSVESRAWRMWTNAYADFVPHGLRLQDLTSAKRNAVLEVMRATLSTQGYDLARDVMRLNRDLGRLLDQYKDTLTEWMYWFTIFGSPSSSEPWGWQIWGHHLDINCLIIGRQLVLTPTFMGTEFDAEELFAAERGSALELINSLSAEQLAEAVVYERFADLPVELQGPVDGRHQGGAGQDNRIIPYEGIRVADLSSKQRALFRRVLESWIDRMPRGPRDARLRELERHLDTTHLAWYGPLSGEEAFYYRVHSPVILIEYDIHPGIFLNNDEPEPFHVHTIVRTPNGNDYGKDILRQHLAAHSHEAHSHDHSSE